jgi:hypothetical protein
MILAGYCMYLYLYGYDFGAMSADILRRLLCSFIQQANYIDQFYNQTIYNNIIPEYASELIERLVQSKVKFLTNN